MVCSGPLFGNLALETSVLETFISYAAYAVIGNIVIVALLFRYLAYRQRKIVEPRRDYHCISAKMYWESGDNPVDDAMDSIQSKSPTSRTVVTPTE
jgi:hypothetical protein